MPIPPFPSNRLTPAAVCLLALCLAVLATTGCNQTRALADGLGADMAVVEAQAARPLQSGFTRSTPWPNPVGFYRAVRKAPAAAVATAYDAPLAVTSEMAQLVATTWGGQDVVTESTYRTWAEVDDVEVTLDPINPLPRFEAYRGEDQTGRTKTGWTTRRDAR